MNGAKVRTDDRFSYKNYKQPAASMSSPPITGTNVAAPVASAAATVNSLNNANNQAKKNSPCRNTVKRSELITVEGGKGFVVLFEEGGNLDFKRFRAMPSDIIVVHNRGQHCRCGSTCGTSASDTSRPSLSLP